jgi:thiamine transporter
MKMKSNLKKLAVSSIFIALSTILSELIPSISLPFGGSITVLSMVPVCLIGIMFGIKWGICSGLVYGVIQMFFGFGNFAYATGFIAVLTIALFDYVVAYGVLGLSGIFMKLVKNKAVAALLGVILCCFLRFVCHFITGVTVWREIVSTWGAIWYSITYNASYMLPEIITTPLGAFLLIKTKALNSLISKA